MTDMTITAVRTTMLRVPWPDDPWLKGHSFGEARRLLVLEVETKGGIVGMGYLFSFRPGLRTVAMALAETIIPRVIGKDATAVEGIWSELWRATVTYNRGGIVTMAMSALDIASRTDLLKSDVSHGYAQFDLPAPPYFSRNTIHYGSDSYLELHQIRR